MIINLLYSQSWIEFLVMFDHSNLLMLQISTILYTHNRERTNHNLEESFLHSIVFDMIFYSTLLNQILPNITNYAPTRIESMTFQSLKWPP